MEKYYLNANIPFEIFKTWKNKCGDQVKTNCNKFLTTENANIPVVCLTFK